MSLSSSSSSVSGPEVKYVCSPNMSYASLTNAYIKTTRTKSTSINNLFMNRNSID